VDFAVEQVADMRASPAVCAGEAAPKRVRRRTLTKVDRRGRLGRRIAELAAIYTAALGADELSPMRRLRVAEAAELKAVAELARGDYMRGDARGSLDDIVRLERRAEQAVKALGIIDAAKPKPPTLAEYLATKRNETAEA
jgi:hypothetical protein